MTAPSGLSKCAVTLEAPASTIPATGGSGSVVVKTSRECQWTAASEAPWLTITGGGSGQGEGTVQYSAAANADPVSRNATINANGQRTEVTQAAGECQLQLQETAASFSRGGGSGSVQVRASSALCSWTANSESDWISIRSGREGKGTGMVSYDVAATNGPPRSGGLTIAGQRYTVTQAEGCTFTIAPASYSAGASGGNGTVAITAGPGCPWTAVTNNEWITVNAPGTGTGSGVVTFTVAPTTGPPRVGTLAVAGETFTVNQSAGCTYQVNPATHTVDASGGTRSVTVSAGGGCPWTATSTASWITIASGGSGAGNGSVTFNVAATTGPARAGTLSIAGQTVTVSQGQGCTYTIAPDGQSVDASGGAGTVTVTAGSGCLWTATSNAAWITVTSGASGSGGGTVAFSVAATTGPSRSGTLTIAGRTFTVNQGQGCTFALSSSGASAPAGGGTGSFDVTTASGCGWSASSNNPSWLTVTSGASGSGTGPVAYSVAANPGPSRSGTITAAGRTFTVDQAGGCTYSIAPSSQNVETVGGTPSVAVTAEPGCTWTASSNAPWITVSSGASGTGNGNVQLAVAANTGAPRTGTATIAGQTFTVNQAGGCTTTISPVEQTLPAGGGNGSFSVNAGEGCGWTAATTAGWIGITSGAGTGQGTVQFTGQANAGPARVGTITVSGQTFTVRQDGGCSYAVAPLTLTSPDVGGTHTVTVTTSPECTWTSMSNNTPWITVSGAATGSGTAQLAVQPNTGPARTGSATVADKVVTVSQDSGCRPTITPDQADIPKEGGGGTVTVTSADGCAWTAVSNNVPWLNVTSGASGAGNGAVQFTVAANPDMAPRRGTLTIAGLTFTVRQN